MNSHPTNEIDRWLASLNERRVADELEQMEQRVSELEERIKADTGELGDLRLRIAKSRNALAIKRALVGREKPTTWSTMLTMLAAATTASKGEGALDAPSRGREAVRALMKERPDVAEWTIGTVLSELVSRGWADPDDSHAVGVSLSRMARAGELERLRKGIYRLPRSDETESELDLRLGPERSGGGLL